MTFYHYHTHDLTESAILSALQYHRQRGRKPQAVIVRPDNQIKKEVDGLPVEVSDKMKPAKHFGVVI